MIPVLTTDRLTLGPLTLDHFEAFANFYASDRSRFVGGIKTRSQSWRQLATEIGHWSLLGYGKFSVTETATGQCVGAVGPWNPEGWPEPEIGWDLWEGYEGKGYATEAARAVRNWCYTSLGWSTAISLVHPDNPGSAAVARRLGCTYEGLHDLDPHGVVQIWRHPSPQEIAA